MEGNSELRLYLKGSLSQTYTLVNKCVALCVLRCKCSEQLNCSVCNNSRYINESIFSIMHTSGEGANSPVFIFLLNWFLME